MYIDMLNCEIVTDILLPSKILGSVACQLAVSPQLSQVSVDCFSDGEF